MKSHAILCLQEYDGKVKDTKNIYIFDRNKKKKILMQYKKKI